MKRATWAAFVFGLLLGLGCGAAKVLPGPTTILVKVHLIAAQNIDQLFVAGTVNGFDEFPRTYLPPDAGAPFNGPQSFRIYLADSEDGKNVEIDVFGLAEGTPLAAGTATVRVVKQHEVEADIDLSPSTDGGSGGGAGGGAGGGSAMGGGGGAVGSCSCDGGCCVPGSTACAQPKTIPLSRIPMGSFVATDCGAAAMTCMAPCDPLRGSCTDGKCSCGGSVCHDGERCVDNNGTLSCRCDSASNCQGCCVNGATCVPVMAQDGGHCGTGGNQCAQCEGGTGAAGCLGGVCVGVQGCTNNNECSTGTDCVTFQFPTCVDGVTKRCTACDPLRSNHCAAVLGASSNGCACGTNKECGAGEYCDNTFNCQQLF